MGLVSGVKKVYDEKPLNKFRKCNLVLCISCRRITEWEAQKKDMAIVENEKLQEAWEQAQAWKPDIKFHPENPLPFYVRDKQNFTVDEMAEWVQQENQRMSRISRIHSESG